MVAGQRYYTYPPGFPFDAIFRIWYPQGVNWLPLEYGIAPSTYATMGGENVQVWPPQRWRNCAQFDPTANNGAGATNPAAQFEIWPIPPANYPYSIRIEANAPLNPLVEDTDTCVIDATLVVLFAAAEILSVQKSEGASLKLQKANTYKRMLVARLGAQQRTIRSLSRDGGWMGPLADRVARLHPDAGIGRDHDEDLIACLAVLAAASRAPPSITRSAISRRGWISART
jgi:hypothetical protein